ncbi:MAG TPA: peptide deformylase [Clostridia bacterium]|nr:peptide deformylase [Clostridia bacterium]
MAKRLIVTDPDEILRKKSREVTVFDTRLHTLLDDMKETLAAADGAGLAAPQVAVLKRAVIVSTDDLFLEMINPKITEQKGEQTGAEGCLSVLGKTGTVTRPSEVTVEYQDRYGKKKTATVTDFEARAVCHELDHLDGILFIDLCKKLVDEDDFD